MSNKLYEENDIQNIANAIRNKNGTEDTYKVSQMSTAINSIEVIEQATAEGESLNLANTKVMPYSDYVVEGKSEQETGILPEGYTQVEYIESTGTQYINTGIVPINTMKIEIKYLMYYTEALYNSAFGSQSQYNLFINNGFGDNKMTFWYNDGTNNVYKSLGVISQTDYNISTYDIPNNLIKNYNNELKTELTDTINATIFPNIPIYIFARNSNNSPTYANNGMKCWYFKVWNNGTLVRNMIPCYRNSDNEIGLYDTVNNVFYTNQGTGTFLKGNNVSIPSPDYPSEIHSVADDVNLFDVTNKTATLGGASYTAKNGEIIINGQSTQNASITVGKVYLKANTNYYFSYNNNNSLNSSYFVFNDHGTYIFLNQDRTFTVSQDGEYEPGFILISGTYSNLIIRPKLQKGSTPTPYSPYNQGTVTIKQRGKNLIDLNRTLGTPSDTSYDASNKRLFNYNNYIIGITSNNYYLTSKITSYNVQNNTIKVEVNAGGYGVGFPIKLKPNTSYILSYDTDLEANQNSGIGFYKSDGTNISNTNSLSTNNYLKFTTPSNCDFVIIIFRPPVNTELTYRNIQLEEGSTATSYETYQTPHDYTIQTAPLRSLPNGVKDTIEADGIHRRVGRIVLDGSENWTSYTVLQNNIAQGGITLSPKAKSRIGYCNNFPVVADYSSTEHIVIAGGLTAVYIHIDQTRFSTQDLAGFKEWLSNNPVTLQYELAEEIIEPLTQNQATTMLDIIKTGSYEGTTNIYTDEDVKPTMKVDYYKKS